MAYISAVAVQFKDAGCRFVAMNPDKMRRAGVQNTKRAERLDFSRLDPYPGVSVQGVGECTESGQARTAAIATKVINHYGDEVPMIATV